MRNAESYRSAKRQATKAEKRKKQHSHASSEPSMSAPGIRMGDALTMSPGALAAVSARTRAATEAAKTITITDVDDAMERALTKHQQSGAEQPLLLSRKFAIRARLLGWIENVEFLEDRTIDG